MLARLLGRAGCVSMCITRDTNDHCHGAKHYEFDPLSELGDILSAFNPSYNWDNVISHSEVIQSDRQSRNYMTVTASLHMHCKLFVLGTSKVMKNRISQIIW